MKKHFLMTIVISIFFLSCQKDEVLEQKTTSIADKEKTILTKKTHPTKYGKYFYAKVSSASYISFGAIHNAIRSKGCGLGSIPKKVKYYYSGYKNGVRVAFGEVTATGSRITGNGFTATKYDGNLSNIDYFAVGRIESLSFSTCPRFSTGRVLDRLYHYE